MSTSLIADRLAAVRSRIADAARAAERDPDEIRLLVATKTQDADAVLEAVEAGARLIGENRVQELVAKAPALADRVAAGTLEVHMIGHLQRNKINQMLPTVTGIESVDGLRLAQALSQRCVREDVERDVMVQVNVSDEESKSGVVPEDAGTLARDVAALPGLRLTGFMTIGARVRSAGQDAAEASLGARIAADAPGTADGSLSVDGPGASDGPDPNFADREAMVRAGFSRLRTIRDEVLASGAPGTSGARELSMGMTEDLELAIGEGATIVRVGTAIFGSRTAARG